MFPEEGETEQMDLTVHRRVHGQRVTQRASPEKDHLAAKLPGRQDPIFGHRMTPHARYEQGVSGIPSVACLTRADSILKKK